MKSFRKFELVVAGVMLVIVLITLSVSAGCARKDTGLRKVTVLLDWTPNTNHTGLFVAKEKGYFEAEGLSVDIIQPTGGTVDRLVAAGTADFGISYQEGVTFARAENVPIVSIAAILQHNTSGFASLKSKNILSPKDFEGKKYGGWGSELEKATIAYLMKSVGADSKKVEILTTGEADFFQASERGEIDFAWIFAGWAGIEAKIKGMDLNYIDLGKEAQVFDYYTPVIITNEKNVDKNPDFVEKFMRAVSNGYNYAISNPDSSADILLKADPGLSAQLVKESQAYLSPKYKDNASVWGIQKKEVWERYMKWLFDNGFIEREFDVSEAFTNEFLD